MSNIFNKTSSGDIHVMIDGFNGTLGAGLSHGAATAETTEAMTKLLAQFEANAATLDDATKAAFKKALPEIEALGANPAKVAEFKNALNFNFAGKTANQITAEIVENPLLRKFHANDAIEKAGVKIAELDGFLKSKESLSALLKASGDQTKAIEAVFIQHHGADQTVIQKLIGSEAKFQTAAASVAKLVTDDLAKLPTMLSTYETAKKAVADAVAAGKTGKDLEPLQTAAKDAGDAITKLGKEPHGGATLRAFEKKDKAAFERLMSDKIIGKEIESASKAGAAVANAASKTEWGWTKKIGPKAEGISGALWKNRGVTGKAAVVAGAGAIIYAIAAATGIIGSKTAEVERSRQQGQAAGLGA